MPTYRTFLSGHPNFFAHLGNAHHMDAVGKNPQELQFPGDITAVGPVQAIPYPEGMGTMQIGRLNINVHINFPDGTQMVFMAGSEVKMFNKPDGEPDMASLTFDIQGQPVQAQQPNNGGGNQPMAGGRRRRLSRRRSTRRRTTHRRRSTRRHRRGTF